VELTIQQDGDSVRFEIEGIIDELGAESLKDRFKELKIETVKELVLDFANVGYIGSAGVGKLLMFYKELSANGGKLRIENASGIVEELLTITRMDTVFNVSTT
jgi:anti-anti-sigma factor